MKSNLILNRWDFKLNSSIFIKFCIWLINYKPIKQFNLNYYIKYLDWSLYKLCYTWKYLKSEVVVTSNISSFIYKYPGSILNLK
jgi:hypothetical protein